MLQLLKPSARGVTRTSANWWSSVKPWQGRSVGQRPTPDELVANYRLDESVAEPAPETVFVVDDVLTTGCHFKAVKHVLEKRFPEARVVGLFIARRAPKSVDLDFDNI